MGWTREAKRGTEGDGGRDGAGSAHNFDALQHVGAAPVYGSHTVRAFSNGRPLNPIQKPEGVAILPKKYAENPKFIHP